MADPITGAGGPAGCGGGVKFVDPIFDAQVYSEKNPTNPQTSKTFFPDTIMGICYVFPTQDIIRLFYRQSKSLCPNKIRLLGL
jgi:hypothetical protein